MAKGNIQASELPTRVAVSPHTSRSEEELKRDYAERTTVILDGAGALLEDDHFVYVNGEHGSGWVDKDVLNTQPNRVSELAAMLANLVEDWELDWVCGPAIGGIVVAQWVAFHLGKPIVFAEHAAAEGSDLRGRFSLGRGYGECLESRRVLVVDDVVNSGHSLRQTVEAVQAVRGNVIGVVAFVDRGNLGKEPFGNIPYRFLCPVSIPSWAETECPAEILARPVNTRYAHGRDYLAKKDSGS